MRAPKANLFKVGRGAKLHLDMDSILEPAVTNAAEEAEYALRFAANCAAPQATKGPLQALLVTVMGPLSLDGLRTNLPRGARSDMDRRNMLEEEAAAEPHVFSVRVRATWQQAGGRW